MWYVPLVARLFACALLLASAACNDDAAVVDGNAVRDAALDLAVAAVHDAAVVDQGIMDAGPHYTIDLSRTSVSGISSGGFMAVQMHVAFSSIMTGAAIFAAGPYGCSGGTFAGTTQCETGIPTIDTSTLVTATKASATAGEIDPLSNLATQRVFVFGGALDPVVSPLVVDALDSYYAALLPTASINYVSRHASTSHVWPTLDYGVACDLALSPFLGVCNYDGAGAALGQIYGVLHAPATTLSGSFLSLAQSLFIASPASYSLADTAFAYVPASCAMGAVCGVHVAFHGCTQSVSAVGDAFYRHAGLNEWADTNALIVLYPQAVATEPNNPAGCWDFWGYTGASYATKQGPQLKMVRAMIDWLASN